MIEVVSLSMMLLTLDIRLSQYKNPDILVLEKLKKNGYCIHDVEIVGFGILFYTI